MQKGTRDRIFSSLPGRRKRSLVQSKTVHPTSTSVLTRLPKLSVGDANLQILPLELLSEVVQSLPLNSKLVLSLTSSYFRSYFLNSGLFVKSIFENEKPPNPDVMSLTDLYHGSSIMDRQWDYLDRLHDLDARGVDQLAQQRGFIDNSTGINCNLITER